MTAEELATIFWDSLERQRAERSQGFIASEPVLLFHQVRGHRRKWWLQAAQDVLDAQTHPGVPIRSCCPPASFSAGQNTTLVHDATCSNRCQKDCPQTKGHETPTRPTNQS